ncbi:hypothetical protein TNCV_2484011 [Trichonephila clavipes]|uniref:Uncharacterized protein n=1 Tax=Trichonephila clavipes TaxID=2585209 RepID=A0A8X6VZN0_TRICX|nr:hypothetical protein TNCV_2484011 [Trichonephila clavipes]
MSECVWLSLFLQGRKHREDDDPIEFLSQLILPSPTTKAPNSFFPLPPPQKRHQSMNCLDSVQDNKNIEKSLECLNVYGYLCSSRGGNIGKTMIPSNIRISFPAHSSLSHHHKRHQSMNCLDSVQDNKNIEKSLECLNVYGYLCSSKGRKHREDDDPIQYTNFFPSSFFPLPPPQKGTKGGNIGEDDDPIQYTNFFPSSFFPLPPPQKGTKGRKHREDDDPIQYTNFFPAHSSLSHHHKKAPKYELLR